MHDRIFFIRRGVWAHKTSLIPILFIPALVPSQESERSCICVLRVAILPLSTIFLLDFGTVIIGCLHLHKTITRLETIGSTPVKDFSYIYIYIMFVVFFICLHAFVL